MADYRNRAEARRADSANLPRVTRSVERGHQIRVVTRKGSMRIRITCLCQLDRPSPWAPPSTGTDAGDWRLYNDLPHDPAAGDFTPVDTATGVTLRAPLLIAEAATMSAE